LKAFHVTAEQKFAVLLREKLSTGPTMTSTAVSSNTAAVLDMNDVLSVQDVVQAPVAANNPPFLTKGWIDDRVAEIYTEFVRKDEDDGSYRKPPMAVVRCCRGGKSRALIELALRIKSRCDITAFRISFNDATALQESEQNDLIGAVCRRIAFAARKDKETTFAQFLEFSVTEVQIKDWLADAPLVLLLDEINLALALSIKDSVVGKEFAIFLKRHFLSPRNRYLVFSSHTVSTSGILTSYMESVSERPVHVRQLPLIPRFDFFVHDLFLGDHMLY
jgi:hypothetical protein